MRFRGRASKMYTESVDNLLHKTSTAPSFTTSDLLYLSNEIKKAFTACFESKRIYNFVWKCIACKVEGEFTKYNHGTNHATINHSHGSEIQLADFLTRNEKYNTKC